jgi:periplasmic protein TonB
MAGGALVVDRIRLPFALSVAGHAVVLVLLILCAAEVSPSPETAVPGGIEVVFSQSLQPPRAAPAPEPPPPQPAPASAATQPPQPKRTVEAIEPPPTPPVAAEAETPLAPRKPVIRQPPKHVVRRPERVPVSIPTSAPAKFAEMRPAGIAGAQYPAAQAAAAVPTPAAVPGPDATASYRAVISAWLESHKRYPEPARQRGEEGSAALRFRIDRSGRVLDYSYSSTGYGDLDAGLDEMLHGAQLPPFPPGMTASRIEVTLTMRFNLTR